MWSRRAFLRASSAVGATALAARSHGLEAVAAASRQVANQSAEALAQDEPYWREIRRGFTLDPTLINLNNGNSSPSPQVVHDAFRRHLDDTNRTTRGCCGCGTRHLAPHN